VSVREDLQSPGISAERRLVAPGALAGLHRPVWIAFALLVGLVAIMQSLWYVDYVGKDNDDVMRLVVVRDLLAGQGWFDPMQYRLGLEGGTPMHWSRLIDLPIAALILFFSTVLPEMQAEAAALFVWPLLTTIPVLYAAAAGARRLSGGADSRVAAVLGLVAAFLFVLSVGRFRPGAIDHHNVQMAIVAVLAACLVQPFARTGAYALGGLAAALAIAVGAETTPQIAIACAAMAGLWLWSGEPARRAAMAFGLTLALALTAFFYLTIPPARYGTVVCDALSLGFYAIGAVGAAGLCLAAAALSGRTLPVRFAGLAVVGAATGLTALLVAPQCLSNPLASLDPLLVRMWLSSVTEAQPVWRQLAYEPFTAGGYYVVPLIALLCAAFAVRSGRMVREHLVLAAMIAVAYAIALIQVRGAVFSNLLSLFVLAPVVASLRSRSNADPKNAGKGLAFAGMALASIPFVWALAGALASTGYDTLTGKVEAAASASDDRAACLQQAAMAPLAAEPDGVVANVSNVGATVLRYTGHRTLSAPYHRNQAGMLAELQIGLSRPEEARRYLDEAGVTLIAFCASDPQVGNMAREAPDGLYAELRTGRVPDWLEPVPGTLGQPLEIFRYRP
jgi:hypothetical protein